MDFKSKFKIIHMYALTDPRSLRVSISNSFLVPILVLAFFAMFVPFLIREHSIYTTQYIYGIMKRNTEFNLVIMAPTEELG